MQRNKISYVDLHIALIH